ncbi:MAG: SPOR domain-containing protein [Bacteroidales bacterium]|nr:SPOR domain-containing protein [Bacteroidales bacterium]MBN2748990.1 SPOR domain-containing protein [Bacteroidales bacterium]
MRHIVLLVAFFSLYSQKGVAQVAVEGRDVPANIMARIQSPSSGAVVTIKQDDRLAKMLDFHVIQNAKRAGMHGFRIRIFFDLGQKSRQASQEAMEQFMEKYPDMAVYRTFDSPYYKVSVGDFRSRDNALKLYNQLKREYPNAFIVPEWVNFPRLD